MYMYAIEQMGAVSAASDALAKYTGKHTTSSAFSKTTEHVCFLHIKYDIIEYPVIVCALSCPKVFEVVLQSEELVSDRKSTKIWVLSINKLFL